MAKKRGRKPIEGAERGETGRIKTQSPAYVAARAARKEIDDHNTADVVKWARMAYVLRELAVDPRMESVCGRMLLIGKPTQLHPREFAAAVRLLGVLDKYDRIVLGVKRSAQAQDVNKTVGLSCGSETPQEAIKAASDAWIAAQGAMGLGGVGCASATMALVREEAWEGRLGLAIAGLRVLAHHWKIDDVAEPKIKRGVDYIKSVAA
ncbi:MAG: hypothetical protein P4M15_07310 [Alphaproteobacteria bacterium]|nr:hypothetical protein [Alphaproteobacteria bacterium]